MKGVDNFMELMFITNNPKLAIVAENAGVDRIFIDLERIGKFERQGHLNTFISDHKLEDIPIVKSKIKKSKLLVRINPIHDETKEEIEKILRSNPDYIMLPMFKTKEEVKKFVSIVNGRAKTILLLETAAALIRIDDILSVNGVDEIHIGLNDLHLDLGLDFMFELLSEGIIDELANKIQKHNIKFGFGGIAKVGKGDIPAELIIQEHERLKSKMVILSRSFLPNRGNLDLIDISRFKEEIDKIRRIEIQSQKRNEFERIKDFQNTVNRIRKIAKEKQNKNV